MAAAYYPVLLDLRDRSCLVVGGGPVAEGKIDRLLQAGACVTVVSPTLTERLAAWALGGRIAHLARAYRDGDVAGHQLAFVATDDGDVASSVSAEGRRRGVWVNAADDPARCDFILPSVLRRGRLVVAVSTGGASPGLARAIREDLEDHVTEDYAPLVELVAEVRREMREARGTSTGLEWRQALDPELRRLIADGRRGAAAEWLKARLGAQRGAAACR